MNLASIIDKLQEKGLSSDDILDVLKTVSDAMPADRPVDAAAERRRAADRERKKLGKILRSVEIPRNSAEPPSLPAPSLPPKENPPKGGQKKGSRLPEDWSLSDANLAVAKREGLSEGEARREAQRFRDWWVSKPGKDGLKLNWDATWRTWCSRAAERLGREPTMFPGTDPPKPTPPPTASPDEQAKRVRMALEGGNWSTRLWGPCPAEISERVRVL